MHADNNDGATRGQFFARDIKCPKRPVEGHKIQGEENQLRPLGDGLSTDVLARKKAGLDEWETLLHPQRLLQ